MAEAAEEVKWGKWAGLEAVDLFSMKVKPQLNKLVTLKELLRVPCISVEGFEDSRISLGLHEILEEATDALEEYFKEIQELYQQERPFRLAWRKSEDERKAKENLDPENLERIAETLSLEAEKFRTKAEEVRAEAPELDQEEASKEGSADE